ncbi:MAG: hypothetical protein CL676_01890 [Bdellovibrionaceae bacterium]|nr:hypothetical protein [Pseudobdellovibrionaceae bacterium]
MFVVFLFAVSLFVETKAWSDLDPVSPYLRGRGSSPSIDTLDSNRFSVKPIEERQPSPIRTPRAESSSSPVSPNETAAPKSVKSNSVTVNTSEPTKTEAKASQDADKEQAPSNKDAADSNPNANMELEKNDNFLDRLRILILGVDEEELRELKNRKSKNSDGENSVEISLSPTYFYYNSSSSYSVKNYSSSAPGYSAGIRLWISPYFGVDGQMQSSMGASVSSLTDNSVSALTLSQSRIGIAFRNIDLDQPLAPQTIWKFSYLDSQASTSSSTGGRVSTKSTGVQISFEADLPSSLHYSHSLGVGIDPKLTHTESSGAQNINSGLSNVTTALSAHLGGRVKFDRKNQVYWKVEHRFEKNLFKGAASYADPETRTTPDGLSVNQSLTLFSIGYIWGK